MRKMLSTGAFAKLCKISKDTLFYYDRIGLLKPRSTNQNGFRYYGVDQYFELNVINLLKETGSSLSSIRKQFRQTDPWQTLELLRSKRKDILEERRRLLAQMHVVDDMIKCLEHAQTLQENTFELVEKQEWSVDLYAFKGKPRNCDSFIEVSIEQFLEYCEFLSKKRNQPRAPYGVAIALSDLLQGRFVEYAAFSTAIGATPKSRRTVLPGGLYARYMLRSSLEAQPEQVSAFMQLLNARRLKPVGDLYICDLMSYFREGPRKGYLMEFLIQVERAN